jgi:hypothetical protein
VGEAHGISITSSAPIEATALSIDTKVPGILSDFVVALESRGQFEVPEQVRAEAITKMQAEMSSKASQFIRNKFSNLSRMTQKAKMDTNNNLEQWKERYRSVLDSNLKLIQHCRLLMIPENLAQKIEQTAMRNIHRIVQEATLDLANSQIRICQNPDSWSVDPTVKIRAMKRRQVKS